MRTNPTSPLGREWFRSPIFPSSNPLLPLRGGVYPSPYPLPWTWRGGFARCQTVLFGPRWLPEGLRALKMASKMAQDGSQRASESPRQPPRRLKMAQDASRWLPRCSKRHQDRPKTAPRGQRASQGGPQEAKILQKPTVASSRLACTKSGSDVHAKRLAFSVSFKLSV